jgi:hypothetical protein
MTVRYLPNPRPTEALTSYTNGQIWVAAPNSQRGGQPVSDSNPHGTYNAVPAMSITAAVAQSLAGPQDGSGGGNGFDPAAKR